MFFSVPEEYKCGGVTESAVSYFQVSCKHEYKYKYTNTNYTIQKKRINVEKWHAHCFCFEDIFKISQIFNKFQNREFPSPVHTGSLCSHVVKITAPSDCKTLFSLLFRIELILVFAHLEAFLSKPYFLISVTSLVPFAKLITCFKLFTFTFLHTSLFKQFFLFFFC